MKKVEEISKGKISVGSGTLHTLLGKFESSDLIRETEVQGRKRSHIIKKWGYEALTQEYELLKSMVNEGAEYIGGIMRISKNKFIKLIPVKEHECKALEEYLEEKALEGWMLEDIICGFLIFKKSKSKKCKFTVDIFTDNNKDEYIEYCEAGGWKYLFQHDKFLIFYTEEKTITPIQTDEEIVLKKVRESILTSLLNNILIIGVMMLNLFISEKMVMVFLVKCQIMELYL